MPSVEINWWAFLAATAISLVIGAIWYSPVLFGQQWAHLVGKKTGEMGDAATGYTVSVVAALVQTWVLVHLVRYAGAITAQKGAEVGFWIWLAFIALVMAMNVVFEGRSWHLWQINAVYFLVILLINGALLATWR
jgi:hypothetical protein